MPWSVFSWGVIFLSFLLPVRVFFTKHVVLFTNEKYYDSRGRTCFLLTFAQFIYICPFLNIVVKITDN